MSSRALGAFGGRTGLPGHDSKLLLLDGSVHRVRLLGPSKEGVMGEYGWEVDEVVRLPFHR
ncbi:hypothetical protein PGT21_006418 [Puccinia graminis f. sp. tritici]|uniref:Uncharacterized protein n=1 Tax=Puccinia graminis f. sp. tritici TaxID=56615 RepID=A0A5B0M9E4_PUCGR|nr:hypothetical protein PGT21_006418 [Puccinia graminis f. sp. tritici]